MSGFRSFDDLQTGLEEMYGANPEQVKNLSEALDSLRNYLRDKYPLINVNGDISGGITLEGTTPDGARIESSSFTGESFIGNADVPPWLGIYNGEDGFANIDISVKNGTNVEATITTRTGLSTFNRTIINSDLIESRSDMGSYSHGSSASLDFTTSTFVGSRPDGGFYFGTSYQTLSSINYAKTSTENLVFIPQEVISGAKDPSNVNEEYGKLLYDIYNNAKTSLTPIETSLIQTQIYAIVQDNLRNVVGITPNDISAIAASQISDIINIAQGRTSYIE